MFKKAIKFLCHVTFNGDTILKKKFFHLRVEFGYTVYQIEMDGKMCRSLKQKYGTTMI